MSNPYDPYNPPQGQPGQAGQQPPQYGAPGGGGGGYGTPYGQNPYGGMEPPKKTDAVSITGFVLSLTCCLSIVGAILGFVGLGRTKNGQRKGRWAAISAIAVGIVGTLAFAGIVVAVVIAVGNTVTPDNAEVGQCVDVESDNGEIGLTKKECTESHDAEIVLVAEAGDYDGDLEGRINTQEVCEGLMPDSDVEKVNASETPVEYNVVIEDPDNVDPSDKFVCYVEATSGKLSDPIL